MTTVASVTSKSSLMFTFLVVESSGSLPPSVGIPLDPFALSLDIPSEFSRQASFSNSCRVSQTTVLEDDCRTRSAGQSVIPRDFYRKAYVPYLTGEGRVTAVHFPARWARLFRREPLQHCVVVEFVAPCQ